MSRKPSRRSFLAQASALSTAMWVGSQKPVVWGQERSANEEIRFACIGVDGKGASDRDDAARHGKIVALCDIDEDRLGKAGDRYADAKKYVDYRKLLEEVGNSIDAVTVSTPDHTHAPAAVWAMKMGKHCFCQKPLTYTVHEARLMRQIAAEKKLCTQMGNQGTATSGLREAVAIIRSGALGAVKEVHIWTNRPIWPQGLGRPTEVHEVPKNLHWDLFLGPAPLRPFNRDAYHPFKWRGWIDFGTGAIGDMACHTMNMAVMALDLFDPLSVEAMPDEDWKGDAAAETYPKNCQMKYEFGPRGNFGPCTLTWYEGGRRPSPDLMPGVRQGASGSLVIGENGFIFSDNDYHGEYVIMPEEKWADFKKPETIVSPGHFTEFADAIKQNKPELAMSNFGYGARLTETGILGNVALRAGKKIEWDAANMKIKNAPELNHLVTREYRKGFELM